MKKDYKTYFALGVLAIGVLFTFSSVVYARISNPPASISTPVTVGDGGTGAITFTNNRLLTGNGTSAIVDEANLTFDGSKLTVAGTVQFSGYSADPQLYATDSTTGINFDASGIISFHGSGTSQGVLSSTNRWGFGATTSPYAKLSIHAYPSETNATLFAIASSTSIATTTLFNVDNQGRVGIVTTSQGTRLQIGDALVSTGNAILLGKYEAATDGNFPVIQQKSVLTAAGGMDLALGARSTSGGILFYTGSDGSSAGIPLLGNSSNTLRMVVNSAGRVGIASTTPTRRLSVGGQSGVASSSIAVYEYKYGSPNMATSTAATIDASTSNIQHWGIGLSATTLTLTGFIPGQALKFIVENPNGTAGALTWAAGTGYQLVWAGGTAPTQTTTANKHDVWVFTATQASSTILILGALSANY